MKYDVARLFATDIEAILAHMLDHIPVTNLGANKAQPDLAQIAL